MKKLTSITGEVSWLVVNGRDTLVEILRTPEDPSTPPGIVTVPIEEPEFPVTVMTVLPAMEIEWSKRQVDDSDEKREQETLPPDWERIV